MNIFAALSPQKGKKCISGNPIAAPHFQVLLLCVWHNDTELVNGAMRIFFRINMLLGLNFLQPWSRKKPYGIWGEWGELVPLQKYLLIGWE
jgi:hypothetical protein